MTSLRNDRHDAQATRAPVWYTTAAHETLRVDGDGRASWVPYDTGHARQVGSSVTACGLVATTWHMFFETSFQPGFPRTCRACGDIVVGGPASRSS